MSKSNVLSLLLAVALLSTGCGENADNKAAAAATEEVESTGNSGGEEVPKEAGSETDVDASAYAVQQGIEFGTPASFSKDYSVLFIDENNYEEVDNEDFHVIDKGLAEFNFYDIKTWPAEKDGYTTAKLTYALDSTNRSHAPEEWGNVRSWKNLGGIDLFDYYTGKYIPESEKYTVNTTGSEQTEPVETTIDFVDKKWDITSWSEEEAVNNYEGYEYTDDSHYDYTEHFSKVKSIFVTYPDDYDGLSFAVQSAGEAKVDMDLVKSAANNDRDKSIGKDILSVYDEEGIKKDDILFCTMKDAASLKSEEVASAEEATIPAYIERKGLSYQSDISLAEGFCLPYEFYVFDENGDLLGEDKVKPDKRGDMPYSIKSVTAEDQGDGNSKIKIAYNIYRELFVDFIDYEGDFTGFAVYPNIDVYDSETGESIEIKSDEQDNSDWYDWKDDTNIEYRVDYTNNAEFTVPTEKLENTTVCFGARGAQETLRFRLSDLL